MACETDSYTKRPRTPNDPYTEMTDEQIRNVKHVCIEYITCRMYLIYHVCAVGMT